MSPWPFDDSADRADVDPTYQADPWPGLAGLSERYLALLRALWRYAAPGTAVAHVRHATLAKAIGLRGEPHPGPEAQGSRQVRRMMKELRRRGLVERTRRMVPSSEGGRREGASDYILKVPLTALPPPPAPLPPPPLGHGAENVPLAEQPPLGHGAENVPLAEQPPLGHGGPPPLGHDPTARTRPEGSFSQVAPLGHDSGSPSKNVPTGQRAPALNEGRGSPRSTRASKAAARGGPLPAWLDHDLVVAFATLQRAGLRPTLGPVTSNSTRR